MYATTLVLNCHCSFQLPSIDFAAADVLLILIKIFHVCTIIFGILEIKNIEKYKFIFVSCCSKLYVFEEISNIYYKVL